MSEFTKKFWSDQLAYDKEQSNHTVAIINGHHYVIGPEDDTKKCARGFGGDKFVIRFFDGTEVTTTNLWYQGQIPNEFAELFPNNADFDWQWKQIGRCTHLVKK